MRIIGLTGGIASGKSTVSGFLRALGAIVLDADAVARTVVEPGQPALAEIVAAWGPDVLLPDGSLDRKGLGARVFADPAARARLNAITHPRVGAETARRLAELAAAGTELMVYDVPLLVESGLHRGMNGVIVVAVPEAVQLSRLMARDGLTEADARLRLSAQLPLADKLAIADWIIDNSGSLDDTRRRTRVVWEDIRGGGQGVQHGPGST